MAILFKNITGGYMADANTAAADGYYGDDDPNTEEIDLSFLDEDEPKEKK
jgi:hypothetical protein